MYILPKETPSKFQKKARNGLYIQGSRLSLATIREKILEKRYNSLNKEFMIGVFTTINDGSRVSMLYEKKIFSVNLLQVGYGGKSILQNLSFRLTSGESLSVMGPNGSGKTTLLHTLAEMHSEYKGNWGWLDEVTKKDNAEILSPLLPRERTYLPQRFTGDRNFPVTVGEVIAMVCASAVEKSLSVVDLKGFQHVSLSKLSAGQFQRMLFARIYAQKAEVVLLDEPFAGLDEKTVEALLLILYEWRKEGRIVLLSQHNRARALAHFPKSLLLGPTPQWGPSEEVLALPQWHAAHETAHLLECC